MITVPRKRALFNLLFRRKSCNHEGITASNLKKWLVNTLFDVCHEVVPHSSVSVPNWVASMTLCVNGIRWVTTTERHELVLLVGRNLKLVNHQPPPWPPWWKVAAGVWLHTSLQSSAAWAYRRHRPLCLVSRRTGWDLVALCQPCRQTRILQGPVCVKRWSHKQSQV